MGFKMYEERTKLGQTKPIIIPAQATAEHTTSPTHEIWARTVVTYSSVISNGYL
jgi:hypothetical protein